MKQQKWNIHTHTTRCGHATGLDIQYIQSAIEAGFTMLGFSEHLPYPEIRISGARMFYEQKDEYIATIRKLKQDYQDKIDIKVGYEVEYLKDHFNDLMNLKKECDYMILGQHFKYLIYDYDSYCSDEDVYVYAQQIEEASSKNFITYVAHPDYFMMGRRSFSNACVDAAHRIAKASIRYDTPLEINLNGFGYGKKQYYINNELKACYPYPFREFWEIIAMYGCKVTFGYDAHSPLTLLERERECWALDILSDLPLNFIDHIELK